MVDAFHFVARVKIVPCARLVGIDDSSLFDPRPNKRKRLTLTLEHARHGVAATLTDHHHDLALAGLVFQEPAILPVLSAVRGFDVAAVDLSNLALAADGSTLQLNPHRLAKLVGEHERGLVGHPEIAREGEHALALDLVREDRDGGEIAAQ